MQHDFFSIILAAGMGKRMKSEKSKVVHKVCGKELCRYVVEASTGAGASDVVVVVGHKAEQVVECLSESVSFVMQTEQLGTGHAVMQAMSYLENKTGYVVILSGDTPLITKETLESAIAMHAEFKNHATVITAVLDNAHGYGRIVRNSGGDVVKIVEQKDANEKELDINEVNSGMYVFNIEDLINSLNLLTNDNVQGEYYLTDTLEILIKQGKRVGAYVISDCDEMRGINDRIQLNEAEVIMRKRINNVHMKNGVTIINPDATYIEDNVQIGQDTIIYPGTIITSGSVIGSDVVVGMNSQIRRSTIEDGVDINASIIVDSYVAQDAHIGPYAYLRPNSRIGKNVKIGDFVEIKNSTLDEGTKVSHLTYIGDSQVGKNVNFGCGTVTVNYDGKKKYTTVVGDNAFIGCNTNLISPVKINANAYIAAGSTITDEVPENALAIARSRQINKLSWADKRGD